MTPSDRRPDDTLEICFSAFPAWILIIFAAVMFPLGALFTMPFAAGQNVGLGIAICAASLAGVAGGRFWLRRLPVMLRLTPEELQFPSKGRGAIRWADIERVEVRRLPAGDVGLVCMKLKRSAGYEPSAITASVQSLLNKVGVGYDMVLNEQEYSRTAEWLAQEFNTRISAAAARAFAGGSDGRSISSSAGISPPVVPLVPPTQTELGPLIAVYPPSYRGAIKWFSGGLLFLTMGAAVSLLPHLSPPKPGEESGVFLGMYSLGGMSALFGLLCWVVVLLEGRSAVWLHANGMVLKQARSQRAIRWTDVVAVRVPHQNGVAARNLVNVLELNDGKGWELDPQGLNRFFELMANVEEKVGRNLAPRLVNAILSGEVVSLGAFALTKDGIQAGQQFAPWLDVAEIVLDRRAGFVGAVRRSPSPPLIQKLEDTPNAFLLSRIRERLLAQSLAGTINSP